MQAAGTRLSRWVIVGALAASLTGLAGAAQARHWHHGWGHRHFWAPRFVTVAPFFRPYYYAPYYRPYYAPPPVAYAPPAVGYPEPTYVPYAAPGLSFNFTVPVR